MEVTAGVRLGVQWKVVPRWPVKGYLNGSNKEIPRIWFLSDAGGSDTLVCDTGEGAKRFYSRKWALMFWAFCYYCQVMYTGHPGVTCGDWKISVCWRVCALVLLGRFTGFYFLFLSSVSSLMWTGLFMNSSRVGASKSVTQTVQDGVPGKWKQSMEGKTPNFILSALLEENG